MFNWLISLFRPKRPEHPKFYGEIKNTELKEILRTTCNTNLIFLSDMDYKLTSKEEIERFLFSDRTDGYVYRKEYYNCDDFSFRLMGNLSIPGWAELAFGIAWSFKHAFNIFLDKDKKVWIIEPQNDRISPIESVKRSDTSGMYYPVRMVIM